MYVIRIGNKYINFAQVSMVETIPDEGTYVHFGPGEEDTSILFTGVEEDVLYQHLNAIEHPLHRTITA